MANGSGYGIPDTGKPKAFPYIQQKQHSLAKLKFDEFHSKHATWFVYLRANRTQVCTQCGLTDRREGDADCTMCFGTGHPASPEKLSAIIAKGKPASFPEGDSIAGLITNSSYRMYFRSEAMIQQGDLLLEVEWNQPQEKVSQCGEPVSIIHVYKIEQSEPIYDGGIVFVAAGCEVYDHVMDAMSSSLFG